MLQIRSNFRTRNIFPVQGRRVMGGEEAVRIHGRYHTKYEIPTATITPTTSTIPIREDVVDLPVAEVLRLLPPSTGGEVGKTVSSQSM